MNRILAFLAAWWLVPAAAHAQDAEQRIAWNRPAEPFRIMGNVHYVGTDGLGAYLVTGPEGHVLIDGGLPESAPLIAANVERLGYTLGDIKYLLVNHGHYDHAGGLAELKRRTGAKMVAVAAEKADLEAGETVGRSELDAFPPVEVDRVVRDGEVLRVGPLALTAHWTPGHTRGCTSWATRTEGHHVLFACSLTVAGQKLVGDPHYPGAARDFPRTFRKLRAIDADLFLNFHPEFFGLAEKRARQRAGDAAAFVDAGELSRQIERAEAAFAAELERQRGQ